jgi:hypothetical protein
LLFAFTLKTAFTPGPLYMRAGGGQGVAGSTPGRLERTIEVGLTLKRCLTGPGLLLGRRYLLTVVFINRSYAVGRKSAGRACPVCQDRITIGKSRVNNSEMTRDIRYSLVRLASFQNGIDDRKELSPHGPFASL